MYRWLSTLVVCIVATPLLAYAKSPTYITAYAGVFDLNRDERKALGGLELRFNQVHDIFVPKVGGFVTNKGSTYFYGGFNLEFPIYDKRLFVIPGFAIGGYSKNSGKNLGGPLEFHSSIELNYKLKNCHRIGVAFGHISNASIYKKNPGEEDLTLTYSIPLAF
jgi:hypothetical protein